MVDTNNLESLKAYAYDIISQLEKLQKELQTVNNLIAKKMQENKEGTKKEEKQKKTDTQTGKI